MIRKHLALALALSVAAGGSIVTTPAAAGPLLNGVKNGVKVTAFMTKVGVKGIAKGVKQGAQGAATIGLGGLAGAAEVARGVKDAF
jgi:hypothetical protein